MALGKLRDMRANAHIHIECKKGRERESDAKYSLLMHLMAIVGAALLREDNTHGHTEGDCC